MITRVFITNLVMVLLLLLACAYNLPVAYAAVSHGETALPLDHLIYGLWVFVFVSTAATGFEVIREYARVEKEAWLAEVMPPLFEEETI